MTEPAPARTQAETRRSWWPGWIWAVPVAAFGVVAWLGVRALAQGGETVTVAFDSTPGVVKGDTKVVYRGLNVGEVSSIRLSPDGRKVLVRLHLEGSVSGFLRSGTRFWLIGAHPSLADLSNLKDALTGPQVGMEPGPGTPARTFEGLDEPPRDAPEGPQIPYLVHFGGDVGELEPGAPVRLKGFRVGRVTAVSLRYDPATRALEAPVQIELEPRRIPFPAAFQPSDGRWGPAVDDMLRTLIARGLRARLAQSPPLIGPREVTLAFVDHAPPASLQSEGGTQVIPAAASPDLSALEGRVGGILDKIDAIPIGQISENVRVATRRLRDLSSSPKLDDTLTHLDQATASLDRAIQRAAPELPPLLTKLRTTADDLDETVAAARRTIGGDSTSQDSDVPTLLRQLTEAARAMRALADEIDRQPEILLRGKPRERR